MSQVEIPSPRDVLGVQQNCCSVAITERASYTSAWLEVHVKHFHLADFFQHSTKRLARSLTKSNLCSELVGESLCLRIAESARFSRCEGKLDLLEFVTPFFEIVILFNQLQELCLPIQ